MTYVSTVRTSCVDCYDTRHPQELRTIMRHFYYGTWKGSSTGRMAGSYNATVQRTRTHDTSIPTETQTARPRRGGDGTVGTIECFRAVRFGASQHIAAQACRLRATCIRMNAALRRSSCAHSHRTPPRRCCRGCGHIFEMRRRTGYRAGWRTTSRAHARDRTRAAWCGR